jgi:hypothetical protein
MLCIPDSEELPGIVEKAGGIGCMLQDAVFLARTVALPALQKQIQARNKCFFNQQENRWAMRNVLFLRLTPHAALERHSSNSSPSNTQTQFYLCAASNCPCRDTRPITRRAQEQQMGQISRCRIGAAARVVWPNKLRPVQVQRSIAPVPAMPSVSRRSRSWNSGTSFFSDAVMQDSWWRLIVYFDVIGMVATRGAPFDSFFSSEHAAAFSAVIQVRAGHFHRHHVQRQL